MNSFLDYEFGEFYELIKFRSAPDSRERSFFIAGGYYAPQTNERRPLYGQKGVGRRPISRRKYRFEGSGGQFLTGNMPNGFPFIGFLAGNPANGFPFIGFLTGNPANGFPFIGFLTGNPANGFPFMGFLTENPTPKGSAVDVVLEMSPQGVGGQFLAGNLTPRGSAAQLQPRNAPGEGYLAEICGGNSLNSFVICIIFRNFAGDKTEKACETSLFF